MAENKFKNIFQNVSILAKKLDVQIILPRLIKHKKTRKHIQSNTPENYFNISNFVYFLTFLYLK